MMLRTGLGWSSLAIVLVNLSACGGGGGGSSPPPPPPGGGNRAPVFGALSFNATEDTDLSARAAATDPEGAALTITSTSAPAHGTLVSLDAATGEFVYRPAANYSGADSFAVRVADIAGAAATGTVSINVAAVNDQPQIADLSLGTDEETPLPGRVIATDVDNDPLTVTRTTDPANGTLQNLAADGNFIYVPNAGFSGTDTFQVRVTDGAGGAGNATVTIAVNRTSPSYAGLLTPVTISEQNAARSARSAWLALKIAVVMADGAIDRTLAAGPVDLTIDGDKSGTLHLTGTLAANGTGTLTGIYAQYLQEGVTLDGRVLFDILETRTATTGRVRIRPKGVRYRDAHIDGTVSGSLLRVDTTPTRPASHVTGELLVEQAGGVQHWFSNVALDSDQTFTEYAEWGNFNFFPINAWTGTLRAHDSRYGYVDVAPEPAFNFLRHSSFDDSDTWSGVDLAYGNGSLKASGSGAKRVWLTPLSPEAFALEMNRSGTTPDVSVAYRWADDFAASAGADTDRLALAVTGAPLDRTYARNGTAFAPEGRFSEQGQGRFLSHHWSLAYVPPGSQTQLSGADTPRPSFTPDRSGDYMLKLRVADGANLSTDYLLVESVGPTDNTPQHRGQIWPTSRDVAGASANTALGQEVILDGRRSFLHYQHPLEGFDTPLVWTIWDGETGQYIVHEAPGPVLRYVAPHIGSYQAFLHTPHFDSAPFATVSFRVGDGPRYVQRLVSQLGYLSVDYDGDGDIDTIRSAGDATTGAAYVQVLRRNAAGRFDAPVQFSNVNIVSGNVTATPVFDDLSNDGRPDLILVNGPTTRVAIQQADGSLSAPVTLNNKSCADPFPASTYLGAVDIDRNGRNDVIRLVCDGTVTALVFNASNNNGTFGPATTIPSTPEQQGFISTSADIDGDGDRELISIPNINAAIQSVQILSLNGSGSFDTTSIPVSQVFAPHSNNAFRIADLNGDGRKDIIVAGSNSYVLTQGSNGAFTERVRIPVPSTYFTPNPPAVGDINGDGRLDVYVFGQPYLQAANGSFALLQGQMGSGDDLLDIDLDGRADFISQGLIDFNAPPQ